MGKKTKKDPFKRPLFVADFEATVDVDTKNQTETEVWSAATCPVISRPEPSDVNVYNNILQFVDHIENLPDDSLVFFHNAKFDLSFFLNELNKEGYQPAWDPQSSDHYMPDWKQDLTEYTYKVAVSYMGQWYSCRLRLGTKTIEFRDSYKKLPFGLREIGESFHTKYQKLEMEYVGERHAGGPIDPLELDYIINDVLVLAEAMHIVWFEYGMTGMTIGADCLREFRALNPDYDKMFPSMTDFKFTTFDGQVISAYDYCHKGYSGGWCWKNPVADNKVFHAPAIYSEMFEEDFKKMYQKVTNLTEVKHILVIDVNSLYPSVMLESDQTEGYPVGYPEYKTGQPTGNEVKTKAIFRRFKCRFKLKDGMLPFIHMRRPGYNHNVCATSSANAIGYDPIQEYTMTQPEFELFRKHYELYDYRPLDYLTFERRKGIFDSYIKKYAKMKIEATKEGNKAKRQIAKLFLNNLYGKLATSTCSSYKTISFVDDVMKFTTHTEYNKDPVYIPAGAYVTAYARRFTITAGQLNYFEGEDKGVMYSDTDSLHIVDLTPAEIKGIKYHKTDFLCWDCEESSVALATYAKQKTYIEVSTEEEFEPILDKKTKKQKYKFIVKAAGMGDKAKEYFKKCMLLDTDNENKLWLEDFRSGLKLVDVNLKSKQIKGGMLLYPGDFKIN